MGGNQSKAKPLNVATLNFAGIAHSPFEFQSGKSEQREQFKILNLIFQNLYELQYGQKPSNRTLDEAKERKLSKMDKCMQRERYSPLYRRDVGIHNGRLMDRIQFMQRWTEEFQKNYPYVKFSQKLSEQQIKHCRIFDYLIFNTFVHYIFTYKLEKKHDDIKTKILDKRKKIDSEARIADHARKESMKVAARLSQNSGRFQSERLLYQKQNQKQRNCHMQAVVQYQIFMQSHFSKAFLNFETKLRCLKQVLEKNDILFLQDASDELINALKNEGKVSIISREGTDCVILLKNEKNEKMTTLYDHEKILNLDNWGPRERELMKVFEAQKLKYNTNPEKVKQPTTAICFVDKYVLLNIHLASDAQPNKNYLKVLKHLIEIKKTFGSNINIIAAGDFNSFLDLNIEQVLEKRDLDYFKKEFKVYPREQSRKTTSKKRTYLQSQLNKADEQDTSCRDFIITDLDMQNQSITVLGQIIHNQDFELLTKDHPFDHAIVSATLVRKK